MGAVEPVAWCQWEAQTLPVEHHCVGLGHAGKTCPTAAGDPCGICDGCIAAQTADLIRHGTPSDLDAPPVPHPEQQEAPAPTGAPKNSIHEGS